jgi:isocitrate/isopropylmalate dehydrogenase
MANPVAMILSAAMMLAHLGEHEAAARVRGAVAEVLGAGEVRTRDLGGSSSTEQMASAVAAAVACDATA